jgi:two-component system chemotaxis response regulator CheY
MKTLIVDDDFASRLLLQTVLSKYGECHIAADGREAVEAFRAAQEQGPGYDLICMDIMMPRMDGQAAVREIRELETARGTHASAAVKIMMTTALDDMKTVFASFKELCDAYIVKPVDANLLLGHLRSFKLIQ